MAFFRTSAPDTEAEFRHALYTGAVFHLPSNPATLAMVSAVNSPLEDELGPNPREAQFRMSDGEFFERVGRLRKAIYTGPRFHAAVGEVMRSAGFNPIRVAFDPIRLRVIAHRGYENPAAAPIYYAHRDTWYAHSQAEITWWIPLHDVTAAETFEFYPDWFDKPVPNNSEAFDYETWTRHGANLRIGWQNPADGKTHTFPGQVGEFAPGQRVGFAAQAGELILFAGAQFHQTKKNDTGRTRFSIDFRTVNLEDHAAEIGAPNTDNRSTGSAVRDYTRLPV
ncbi:MAG TPA: hypothetical protein VKE74_19115 [Gemmataceae bacterium]|nr:hypothetical protein [Gemmataceae bacterium]